MAWTASGQSRQLYADILDKTLTTFDFDAAAMLKAALYNNSITPDFDATAANFAYNAGQWATANEVYESGQWAQGGIVVVSNDITVVAGGIVMLDADDVASGSAFTATNIYGCLVYLDGVSTPVADQGVAGIYFGGTAFQVTNGVFTIQWSANGIYRFDVA